MWMTLRVFCDRVWGGEGGGRYFINFSVGGIQSYSACDKKIDPIRYKVL